jgi:hypothetical protein
VNAVMKLRVLENAVKLSNGIFRSQHHENLKYYRYNHFGVSSSHSIFNITCVITRPTKCLSVLRAKFRIAVPVNRK